MVRDPQSGINHGFTIVELMVTLVVVALFAVGLGVFVSKMLTFQENEREEAYIRENLVDVCGAYADFMSVGSSISAIMGSTGLYGVDYRKETGGVSLETGIVSHVTAITSAWSVVRHIGDKPYSKLDINAYGIDEFGQSTNKLHRNAESFSSLIPIKGTNYVARFNFVPTGRSGLVKLEIAVEHGVKIKNGMVTNAITRVERIVRLWNSID